MFNSNADCWDKPSSLQNNQIHPSNADRFLPEFRLSAIPDRLTLANVRWVEGDAAIELLTEEAISQVQKVTSYLTEPAKRIRDRYEFATAGGWVAYGQILDGSLGAVAYFKAISPRQAESKGFDKVVKIKTVKYETPSKEPATPILPYVDKETAQVVYDKHYCVPEPGETFWQVVRRYNIPIAITEGLKKALCLIGQGTPAICLRGIGLWRITGTDELHPTIADFATKGREVFIVFDQDEKESTQKDVRTQILKLGAALTSAQTQARVAVWCQETGKGIDDAVYALKGGASEWLKAVFEDAPTIKEFKGDLRILKAQATIAHHNTLSYPAERATTGEYTPELPKIQAGAIHAITGETGAGKTYRIGKDLVKPCIEEGMTVIVLEPNNYLGKQTAVDFDLPHIHDFMTDRDSQIALWADVNHRGGLVMCGESLHRIPDSFWPDRRILLVVDEANQVVSSLTQGDTLGPRYSDILTRLEAVSRCAIQTGAIVLSEAGLPDRAVKFFQNRSGGETVRVFSHKKEYTPWPVTLMGGQLRNASEFRSMFLESAESKRLVYVTTSQREGERMERALTRTAASKGLSLNIVRIDSKTNEGGKFTGFFENPNLWLSENNPDILILSPSVKSGVSIQGNVTVEDSYFDEVWGYFPSLTTDIHMQMLGRVRPSIPRFIFCPDFIQREGDEALLHPGTIRRRLSQNAKSIASIYGLAALLEDSTDLDTEGDKGLETAVLDYLSIEKAVAGCQKSIANLALANSLKKAGHHITERPIKGDKNIEEMWKSINTELWMEEAEAIASSKVEAHHTLDWATKILNGLDSSLADRTLARKVRWRADFPTMMFDCTMQCFTALTNEYGKMARGVKMQAKAENIEGARLEDSEATKAILSGNIKAFHRLPRSHVQALLIKKTGVLELLDGKEYDENDPRCLEVKKIALSLKTHFFYWLGFTITETQKPIEICHKMLKRLGLQRHRDAVQANENGPGKEEVPGAIKVVGRFGKRNANIRRYRIDLDYCNVRARLLEAARNKINSFVTTISKEDVPLEIVVTLPRKQEIQSPESGAGRLEIVPESDVEYSEYFEYIPSPEDSAA